MSINAREAHAQTVENNNTVLATLIGDLDSKIDVAIYEGEFSITTMILSRKMQNKIREHYGALEYEILDCGNGMLTINW